MLGFELTSLAFSQHVLNWYITRTSIFFNCYRSHFKPSTHFHQSIFFFIIHCLSLSGQLRVAAAFVLFFNTHSRFLFLAYPQGFLIRDPPQMELGIEVLRHSILETLSVPKFLVKNITVYKQDTIIVS